MGTEAFWVPAVVSAIGAGTTYANNAQAEKRADHAQTEAIIDQADTRQKANSQVQNLTRAIAQNGPQSEAAKSTGEYVDQLRRNAAGSTQGGTTTGGAQTFGQSTSALPPNVKGERYAQATASGQKESQAYGNTLAEEMGQLDAATRQRQNEGLGMQTLGTNLNTLGLESYGKNFVDQLRAQVAGRANPWVGLGGNIISNTGGAMSMNPDAYFKPKPGRGTIPVGATPTPTYDGWEGVLA